MYSNPLQATSSDGSKITNALAAAVRSASEAEASTRSAYEKIAERWQSSVVRSQASKVKALGARSAEKKKQGVTKQQ